MAGGHDRLSELPDDLLRRVLRFVPLKEAASTTALSRRWRAPLWLSSGAVNLETGSTRSPYDNPRFFTLRDDFLSAAKGSLDAADAPVTRLTLRLGSDLHQPLSGDYYTWRLHNEHDKVVARYTAMVDAVLSHPAARRVEELRLSADRRRYYDLWSTSETERLYTVALASLPLETLEVLELTNCKRLLCPTEHAAAVVLPRLSSLCMRHCSQHLGSLQSVVDAAPALAAIRLDSVLIDATDNVDDPPLSSPATPRRLRCPAVTVLVLDNCTWEEKILCRHSHGYTYNYKKNIDVNDVEIDAPRLRRFSYKGPVRSFSFSPPPLELELVDLDFSGRHTDNNMGEDKDPDRALATFWRFARSFTSTKEMRIRVKNIEDIAVLNEARRVELLPAFRRLQRLEVQGVNQTIGKTPAMAILNLLRCCPALSALRINLTAEHHKDASNKEVVPTQAPQKEIQIAALLSPRHYFKCLQSSLTRVGLQFPLEKSDCFGVKLIKFFAENAMVLEEMRIDGGDERLCEHLKPKTEKWNSKRRKSGATSFVVLPLRR